MKKITIIILVLVVGVVSAQAISNSNHNVRSTQLTAGKIMSPDPQMKSSKDSPLSIDRQKSEQVMPIIAAVDCPPGAQIEEEDCGEDNNGGCLMTPGSEQFESISCGVFVCGTYWSDDVIRDTDWYELVLTERGFVRWLAVGDAPTRIWMYDGNAGCTDAVWLASAGADPSDTASAELELPAGTYWLVVGPDDWYDMPCDGSGDYGNNYVASVICELGTPILSVVPDSVYGEALEGFTDTETVTISNAGEGRLNFTTTAIQDLIMSLTAENRENRDYSNVDLPTFLASEKPSEIEQIYENLPLKINHGHNPGRRLNMVDCPGDGIPESESCGDDINGGCAMAPGTEAFETLNCNTTVCGKVWSDGSTRDTDWFILSLTEPTLFTWSVTADFPLLTLILLPGTTGNECGNYEALIIEVADPGDTAKIVASLPIGEYWMWVGPTGWYDMPCDGTGEYENDYVASLKCEPPWLSIDVISGSLHEGDSPVTMNVLLDATDLLPGTYTGDIIFNSNDEINSPLDVPVVFVVNHVYEYIPGDANMTEGTWPAELTGGDVTYLVNFFRSSATACLFDNFYAAADVNGDCRLTGNDVTYLVNYFRSSNPLPNGCPDFPHIPPTEENYPACTPVR